MREYAAHAECYAYTAARWYARAGEVKDAAARLINARGRHEIAFVPNTSTGLALVARGLTWRRGDSAVITHVGAPFPVSGVYESEYAQIDLSSGMVQSTKPAFWCKTSDVPDANQNDTLLVTSELHNVSAVSYSVAEVQRSPSDLGLGVTRFVLKKA